MAYNFFSCTDEKGEQEKYSVAVEDWKEFHDSLPSLRAKYINDLLQGNVLKCHLYGHAENQFFELTKEKLKSEENVNLTDNVVYWCGFMSVLLQVCTTLLTLINSR